MFAALVGTLRCLDQQAGYRCMEIRLRRKPQLGQNPDVTTAEQAAAILCRVNAAIPVSK